MELNDKEKAMAEVITKTIEEKTKGLIDHAAMEEAITKALADNKLDITTEPKFKELAEAIKGVGIELTAMKEQKKEEVRKSIIDQLKAQLESRKEEFADFVAGKQKNFTFEIDTKVAANMLVSTNVGAGAPFPQIIPGMVDAAVIQPGIITLCNYGSATSPSIQWVEKKNKDGAAAAINDATIVPLADFDLDVNTSTAADYAAATTVHANMLTDIDFVATEIEKNLTYEVNIVADNATLAYIISKASAFNLTTLKVKTPNVFDAIMAAATQVVNLYHTPTVAVLNPIDYANMVGSKDTDGGYVMPPFSATNGATVFGLRVVQNPQVTAGNVLVGNFGKANVREVGSMSITAGWHADDFRYRRTTFLGVRRIHNFIPDNDCTAFVYDAIQDITDAITLP